MRSRRITSPAAPITALLIAAGLAVGVGGPAGASAATTTLGGFTITSLAEGSTVNYEQPNFPVPATPTLELDVGYAATTDNFGPSGSAVASVLYPGQVVANAGPELSTLEPGLPLPPAPTWPVQARSTYPAAPNASSDDEPGTTMAATSSGGANTATAQLGNATPKSPVTCAAPGVSELGLSGLGGGIPAGAGIPSTGGSAPSPAATSAISQVQDVSGQSSSSTAAGVATASATATDSCVSILGGLLSIGSVTSTATATSNGTGAALSGSTTVQDATLAGEPVTIDSAGIHAAGNSTPQDQEITALEQDLTKLGITVTVTKPTDSQSGPAASRQLDGLRVEIDLTTLDQEADTESRLLPPTLTAKLPLPVPNEQEMVWDIATVDVQVAASPAYAATPPASTPPVPAPGAGASPALTPGAGATGATAGAVPAPFPASTSAGAGDGYVATAATGTTGSTGTAGTATPPTATGSGARRGVPAATDASSSIPLGFGGIGAGLVILGLLAALALAFGSTRATAAAEAMGGDPGHDLEDHEFDTHEFGDHGAGDAGPGTGGI
jgi:hypothetical protein